MVRIPTADIPSGSLQPTQADPSAAATLGGEVVDLSKGLVGLSDDMQKLQTTRQVLKAQDLTSKQRLNNYQIAQTDPDVDNVMQKITDSNEQSIQNAAAGISDPVARDKYVESERSKLGLQMIPIQGIVYRRTSQDVKNFFNENVENSVKELERSADPEHRQLLKDQLYSEAEKVHGLGHVDPEWAKTRVKTAIEASEINQISSDMGMPSMLEHVARELEKGDKGMYKDVPEAIRVKKFNEAVALMKKNGAEDKMIYAIAQNDTENKLADKMANGGLTAKDIVDARSGKWGIPASKEFSQAATEAIQQTFPGESNAQAYSDLHDIVSNPDIDPGKAKTMILRATQVSSQEKAKLLNTVLRENEDGEKKSINNLIKEGLSKNREAILEAKKRVDSEVERKRSTWGKIQGMLFGHAKDDKHLADLQRQFTDAVSKKRNDEEWVAAANEIMRKDTLNRNPRISSAAKEGTIFMDKATGYKRKYYPDGHWEPAN